MKEIKKSVILFAGTTEGRLLAEYLQELDQPFVICVATGYGRDLLEDISRPDENGCMEIRQGRLDVTEMERMFDELRPELAGSHPYAGCGGSRCMAVLCGGKYSGDHRQQGAGYLHKDKGL